MHFFLTVGSAGGARAVGDNGDVHEPHRQPAQDQVRNPPLREKTRFFPCTLLLFVCVLLLPLEGRSGAFRQPYPATVQLTRGTRKWTHGRSVDDGIVLRLVAISVRVPRPICYIK